jgi:hypothetical protein
MLYCGALDQSLYNTKQVKLWLHHRGVRIRYTTKITVGELPQIEKRKAASAVALTSSIL